MKIRNGFVSNSSSSSFLVVLPDELDIKTHVQENIEFITNILCDYGFNEEDYDREIKKFIESANSGSFYDYENSHLMRIADDLFGEYSVCGFDVSSDGGEFQIMRVSEMTKKLEEIKNEYSRKNTQ